MVNLNSGYIVDGGISTIFNLMNNKVFDLSVFTFGIGSKANFIFDSVDITGRKFSYLSGVFTLTSGDTLPTINLTTYPYVLIKTSAESESPVYSAYKVLNATSNTLAIDTGLTPYTGTNVNVEFVGFAKTNVNLNGKLPDHQKQKRNFPAYNAVLSYPEGILGDVASIAKSVDEENTVEINCEIPEDSSRTEAIYFDEVYLYGRNESDPTDTRTLIFVAETIYGTGVYTGQETNIFNIRISLSNLNEVSSVEYKLNNLGIKQDIEVLQLMFLYILSFKNKNLRDLTSKLDKLDAMLEEYRDPTFLTILFDKLKEYILNKMKDKYETIDSTIYNLNIDLMSPITQLSNTDISTLSIPDGVVRAIGIVPKYIGASEGSATVAGLRYNTFFYVNNSNLLKAWDMDNDIAISMLYSISITEFDEVNINCLDSLISSAYNPFINVA